MGFGECGCVAACGLVALRAARCSCPWLCVALWEVVSGSHNGTTCARFLRNPISSSQTFMMCFTSSKTSVFSSGDKICRQDKCCITRDGSEQQTAQPATAPTYDRAQRILSTPHHTTPHHTTPHHTTPHHITLHRVASHHTAPHQTTPRSWRGVTSAVSGSPTPVASAPHGLSPRAAARSPPPAWVHLSPLKGISPKPPRTP